MILLKPSSPFSFSSPLAPSRDQTIHGPYCLSFYGDDNEYEDDDNDDGGDDDDENDDDHQHLEIGHS